MAKTTQQKQYTVKIFDKLDDTTFVKNMAPILLKEVPTFKAKINAGLGETVIDFNLPFDDFDEGVSIDFMNIVEIFVIDEDNPLGRRIHKGFISKYTPYINADGEEGVRITVLGLVSLLSFSFYKTGASFTVSHAADDPETIARAIIDHFNTVFPGSLITFDGASTDPVGTSVSYEFVDRRWDQALTKTVELASGDFWYHIDQDGKLQFKDKPATATHRFTIGKDIESIVAPKNAEKIANDVQVRFTGGGTSDFSDATSITAFGTRTKLVIDTDISNAASATERGDREIAANKDEKIKASITINTQFEDGLEAIRIGDTCKIQNLKFGSTFFDDNMQIRAYSYRGDTMTLELEEFEANFGEELETFVRPDGTGA